MTLAPEARDDLGLRAAWGIAALAVTASQALAVLAPDDPWPRALHDAAAFVDGRSTALVLFLTGLVAARVSMSGPLLRAGVVLLIAGTALRTVWPHEILQVCGFALFAVTPLRQARMIVLLALAAGLVAVSCALLGSLDYGAGWGIVGRSREDVGSGLGELRRIVWNGWTPLLPWLAFPVLGVAVERLLLGAGGLRTGAVGVAAAVLASGTAVVSGRLVHRAPEAWWEWWRTPQHLFDLGPLPPGPTFVVHAAAIATVVVVACRMLARTGAVGRLAAAPWVAAGAAPWTALLVGGPLAAVVGRELGPTSLEGVWAGVGAAFVALVAAGAALQRLGLRGPIEWVAGRLSGPASAP